MGPAEEGEDVPVNPDEERQERYAPRPQFSRENDRGPVRRSLGEGGDFRRPPMQQRDNYAPRRPADGGYDSRPPRRDDGFDARPPRRDFGSDSRPPRRDFGDRPPIRRTDSAPRRDDFRKDAPPPRRPFENRPARRPEQDSRPQTPKIGSGDLVTKEPDEVEEVSLSRLLPKKE